MLDSTEVHRHVADIAEQARAGAIGRDIDLLCNVGAVEQQRIGAVLAFDDVTAIARIPLERIVSSAKECDVTALIAVDEIVSVAADQGVIAGAAEDRVIAAPPSIVSVSCPAASAAALMVSLPPSALM